MAVHAECAEELPPCPEFIQNHTQCWCASGNLTPIDLRGAGHSGLSGGWQMTEKQIIYCCHNVTTSLALWPSVWFENLHGVDTADVTLGQNLSSELLFSILFCFSLLFCCRPLAKQIPGSKFCMVTCEKRQNVREINFEGTHSAWLTKNPPTAHNTLWDNRDILLSSKARCFLISRILWLIWLLFPCK